MYKERNFKIDILRAIGLLCIILAHVSPPPIIFQLRNFDVVLMIFIMGISYSVSRKTSYFTYIYKRFKRLVIPAWIFLTIFFCIFKILGQFNNNIIISKSDIISSYFFVGGIGYIWIIRVYFLMAIISPIILLISNKIKNNFLYLTGISFVYIPYLVLININNSLDHQFINFIIYNYVIYTLGYGIICAIGIRYNSLSKNERCFFIVIQLVVFVLLMFYNSFSSTQVAKFPPRAYYFSYGLLVTGILYELLNIKSLCLILNNKILKWISINSLWLYFWHIIPVKLLNYIDIRVVNYNFVTRFLFCLIFAVIFVIVQKSVMKIANKILSLLKNSVSNKI